MVERTETESDTRGEDRVTEREDATPLGKPRQRLPKERAL